jgi:hypothetical protein
MTREEAITVLKAFMENPLFSDEHKQAFNIAIHDIKQRHDWDINNLILVNKDNYEPLKQEPSKPMVEIDLYSVIKQKYIEREVLDKVRAELESKLDNINRLYNQDNQYDDGAIDSLQYALDIINKYKGETENI